MPDAVNKTDGCFLSEHVATMITDVGFEEQNQPKTLWKSPNLWTQLTYSYDPLPSLATQERIISVS